MNRPYISIIIGIMLLLISSYASLRFGAFTFSTSDIGSFLTDERFSKEALVFWDIRFPRVILTMLIGAGLAVAGAVMQSITRNPLASPSIFGINAGASFTVVLLTAIIPYASGTLLIGGGFLGALITAGLIFFMSAIFKGGNMEIKLALVGISIQAIFAAGTQSLLLFHEESAEKLVVWLSGTTAGASWEDVQLLYPFILSALLVTILLAPSLSVLSLGSELARGLGQNILMIRIVATFCVIILAGSSVSIAGPIGFVGLITPHAVRFLAGTNYRVVIPLSAIYGASLLLFADLASRFILYPYETPVGIITAVIGTPFFIYLARKRKRATL